MVNRRKSGLCFVVALMCLCFPMAGIAQPDLPLSSSSGTGVLKSKSVLLQLQDTLGGQSLDLQSSSALRFANAGKPVFYQDKRKHAALSQLPFPPSENELEAVNEIYTEYVRNFGIKNFRDSGDVRLIWKLGKVREMLKDTAGALYFYELAIKHRRNWGPPRVAMDDMLAPTRSEWLPIEEYYRLLDLRKKIDPLIPPKSIMTNMGRAINSNEPDYAPYMHPSDSVLIFTSRRGMADFIDPFVPQPEELYYSVRNFMTGKWDVSERFTDEINSRYNEGSACLSPDGKTLYFTRCDAPDGHGDCDLYVATYDAGKWKEVQNLGEYVNSRSWDSHPFITPDGKVLFFASNRTGGYGAIDLYYTYRKDDGSWSLAQNLGPMVNTVSDEVSPFFHAINSTLYFGSSGQIKNYGGFDIFKSRFLGGGQWEAPRNVGPLINTRANEYYFTIDGKGNNIYYASSKRGELISEDQDFDIFSFPMPMESKPDAITRMRGVLIDSVSGKPLVGTVLIIDLDNRVEIAPKRINDKGYFEFDLKNNNRYRIYVLGSNFLTIRNDMVLGNDTSFTIFTESIEQQRPLVFESLEFSLNSYKLEGHVKPKLDYIVEFLRRYPMYTLSVEGHTDADGNAEYNKDLSLQRAKQIQAYIVKEGPFPDERVAALGFGEERPLVPNDSEENKRKNRRVEFRMIFDTNYKGDMFLPMEEELKFDEEFLDDEGYDPVDFLREFDMLDEVSDDYFMDELELDEDDDLEMELLDEYDEDDEPVSEDDDGGGG